MKKSLTIKTKMEIICNTPETSSLSSQLRMNGRRSIFDSHQVIIKQGGGGSIL